MNREQQSKQPLNIPEVTKQTHCPECKSTTLHKLVRVSEGADLVCSVCANPTTHYSYDDMVRTVMFKVFNLPDKATKVDIPEGFEVYLEHHGTEATEMQASPKAITDHVRVTGQLPKKGKPLFAHVGGAAIPFGKVVRISESKK